MITNENDGKISDVNYEEHWNTAYRNKPTEKLGWYEDKSTKTVDLIKKTKVSKGAKILNIGVGSSTVIDDLLAEGYYNLIANDLSEKSLNDLKERVKGKSENIQFIVDNIIKPSEFNLLNKVDVWNDRAVLHFFLKESEQKAYFDLLKHVVRPGGFVVIAVFALNGSEKCCGLDVQRYDTGMLQERLGEEFELKEFFNYTFINPNGGEKPYIYTLFQRQSN